jgi:hypothetical protein
MLDHYYGNMNGVADSAHIDVDAAFLCCGTLFYKGIRAFLYTADYIGFHNVSHGISVRKASFLLCVLILHQQEQIKTRLMTYLVLI